jgi:hypothetical protein
MARPWGISNRIADRSVLRRQTITRPNAEPHFLNL